MYRALPLALAIFAMTTPDAQAQRKPRLRLIDDQKHSVYMQFWPKSKDPWLNELKKKDIIFYNDSVMPAAYWSALPSTGSPRSCSGAM